MDLSIWTRRANGLMKAQYAITLEEDAGLDADDLRRFAEQEPDPAAFVAWFAVKYDLDRLPRYLHRTSI
jgi:hypothetical protein